MLLAKPSQRRARTSDIAARRSRAATFRAVSLELLLVAGLLLAYRFGRLVVAHPRTVAVGNATHLIGWECALRLPNELLVQHALLASHTVTRLANIYYVSVHFPLTAAFLVWLFVRSRSQYCEIRTAMALLTGFALIIHAVFPLAPARMLHGLGFVDTAAVYGPSVYASSPQTDRVTNQFAAMPSLHFGWAVMVALGFVRVGRSRLRWLWIAHPVVTLLVIVGTGNHYWADAVVATFLLVLAQTVARAWTSVYRAPRRIVIPIGRSTVNVPCLCRDQRADGPPQMVRSPSMETSGGARAPPPSLLGGAWIQHLPTAFDCGQEVAAMRHTLELQRTETTMTIDTAVTMRGAWCQRCRDQTPHVYADLTEGSAAFHVDQCLECGRWSE